MFSSHFNRSRIIAEMKDDSCGIPTDVTFQIVEDGQLHEVKAHKMIVAMVSDTFKTMFYSTQVGDKNANVIKVKETTAPAFRILMDALYDVKSIGESLSGKSVDDVFDVINLIERYQIKELMEPAKEALDNYPVTEDNVLEVAGDALEYSKMFEAEVQQLLLTCAKFLMPKLKDAKSMMRYAAENEDRKLEFATLVALMNDIKPHECPKFFILLDGSQKKMELKKLLRNLSYKKVFVFVNTVARCNDVTYFLKEENFNAKPIHGVMKQEDRTANYEEFEKLPQGILVATKVFSRGMDIKDGNIVINYDMTENTDDYLHRVGRGGRYGVKALSISFVTNGGDEMILKQVEERFGIHIQPFDLKHFVEFMKKYNLPLMLLGGGGYTIRNVARCWTYETSCALEAEIPNELPYNDYFEYFGPDFKLHIASTTEYVDKVRTRLLENLRMLPHAPGVQMSDIPEDAMDCLAEEDVQKDNDNPDTRKPQIWKDKTVEHDNEFEESPSALTANGKNKDHHSFNGDANGDKTNGNGEEAMDVGQNGK